MNSARTEILSRYVTFFQNLRSSVSFEVRVLANLASRDLMSTTGKNIRTVGEASGLNPWEVSSAKAKAALRTRELVEVLPQDRWRIGYLFSLLRQLQESVHQAMEEKTDQLQKLFDSLVI